MGSISRMDYFDSRERIELFNRVSREEMDELLAGRQSADMYVISNAS
jgi:hypothetical protein